MNQKIYNELKPLIILALPLIASGLVEFSSGFFSTLMLGHVSHAALAAGTLINNIFTTLIVFLWGLLGAVSVLVSQRFGAGDDRAIPQVVQSALALALIVTPIALLLLYFSPLLLHFFHQDKTLVQLAKPGLHAFMWGVFPDLINLIFLQFAMGIGRARVNLLFSLLWAPCNIFFVAVFVFGLWHFPKLGVEGLGVGFSVSAWIVMLCLSVYFFFSTQYDRYRPFFYEAWSLKWLRSLLHIGMPIGGVYTIDLVYLLLFALLMGVFGVNMLAAHQIVMQYFWQTSVISFAIGQAITVKVGHYVGEKNIARVLPVTIVGILFMLFMAFLIALLYWFFPVELVQLDLGHHPHSEVTKLAVHFFMIAAFVQLFQCAWVGLLSALRGWGDTHVLMWLSAIAEFGVGLPVAWFLAFHLGWQGTGLWSAMLFDSVAFILLSGLRLRSLVKIKKQVVLSSR